MAPMKLPRTIVLDPMLRAIADIPCDHPDGHDAMLDRLLLDLPSGGQLRGRAADGPGADRAARFRFSAVRSCWSDSTTKSAARIPASWSTMAARRRRLTIHSQKRRQDMIIALPELRQRMRERIVTRLLPAIELYFSFKATRMDRYTVSCYDSEIGGYFRRHGTT